MDLYPYPTEVITIFYSLRVSGATIGRYSNNILMMSGHIFFFNKKIAYSSSVFAFITKVSNSIIKSAVFYFPCLKDSIFNLASAVFILSLNIVLIFLTNSSQSWIPSSLSSSSSFLWA